MWKKTCLSICFFMLLALTSCRDPELPKANSKLLTPSGNFTLLVSNQSFEIDPVDVRIEIDGELVVSDYFKVGTQHSFTPFKLQLSEGKHKILIWSIKGSAELTTEFDLKDHDVGVASYSFYPKSHDNPTPKQFHFHTQKGPFYIE